MLGRDKVQLSRIQLRHMFAVALTLAAVIAIFLLFFNSRNNYYEELSNQVHNIINEADRLPPIEIESTTSRVPPGTITQTGSVKVILYSQTKQKRAVEYYFDKKLRAISSLDESEKLVRQDIFDLEDRIRIRFYYNSNGDLVQKEFFDENGRRVVRKVYIPGGGIRTGY